MRGPTDGSQGEVELACDDLAPTLAFFTDRLGFRIETIFPADEPKVASLTGHGLRIRLAPGAGGPGVLRLPCASPPAAPVLTAPNGARIEWVEADPAVVVPPLVPVFVLTRRGEGPAPAAGRAGMIYRDLMPDRQGGRFIASHIAIPGGGPVADWVHFHKIRLQMIVCRRGWVRVVYEDQGPPLVMRAGDCVLQPPRIRHRVLEASPGLEVVELACPALHETVADHDMSLPTGRRLPERDFGGQRFVHHIAASAPWRPVDGGGFERRDSAMALATDGLAEAWVLRPAASDETAFAPHGHELLFGFLLEGSASLSRVGEVHALGPADAFVMPPGEPWALGGASSELELLLVSVG